jgi:hypothetical protein
MNDTPARWHPDPSGRHDHRYWDGTQWTDHVADAGVASNDPVAPAETASPDAPTAITPVTADDTDTYPTAAAAPPYAPPLPVATGGDGPGTRTRTRALVIGGAILAAVALAVFAIIALGGDDDEPTAPLADESTSTTLEDEGDPDGSTDETSDPSSGEDPGDGFSDEELDDFEDSLSDAYAEQLGLSDEQAACLAGRISELVEDGEFSEEQAMTDVFEFLSDCDISMDDLTEAMGR